MAFELRGPLKFRGGRDSEGHREYKVSYLVGTTSNQDGPLSAMNTPGLPLIGATYIFGSGAEFDLWAWCRPDIEVEEAPGYKQGEFKYLLWVTVTFSTKPRARNKERPQNTDVMDPLAEPQKVSGTFTKSAEEALVDRFGAAILTSSWEQIRGAINEWSVDRPCIHIEQNVADLQLGVMTSLANTLNSQPLWGLPIRSIKFSPQPWDKHWGKNNSFYYTRKLDFEIRVKPDTINTTITNGLLITSGSASAGGTLAYTFSSADVGRVVTGPGIPSGTTITGIDTVLNNITLSHAATSSGNITITITPGSSGYVGDWDRDIPDEGTKALRGYWKEVPPGSKDYVWTLVGNPSPDDPSDFVRFVDPNGNPAKVLLDGAGYPWFKSETYGPGVIHVEKYPSGNLLLLNIPTSF